ncbi:MAG: hypothetical protein JSV44_10085 [Candidatus Zixiibacteriota bacterium]|nr:MAG: hypothetical protein JSV44_10085 [candidate division Zixibacteria bacterium]
MYRNLLMLLLTLVLAGFLVGCSSETSTSVDDRESIADSFGGLEPTDEAPAFGDPVIASEMVEDENFDDPLLTSPDVESLINDANVSAYALRIIWGSLEYDPSVTTVTDWTGSLKVSDGAIVVRKLIRFEPTQDYILPRTDRKLVEWVSATTVHHDGIFVYVYIPPVVNIDPTVAIQPMTITFDTEPFEITFSVSDLAALDTIHYLDDSVNAVAFRAFKIEPMACPSGFLEGRWGRNSEGQGVFFGRWMAANGFLLGHLRGFWGPEEVNGVTMNVFYGKYIDISGTFKGLIKGIYAPYPGTHADANSFCRCSGGWFLGHFYDAQGTVQGILKGHYMMPRRDAVGAMGYFAGRWKTYCPKYADVDDGLAE